MQNYSISRPQEMLLLMGEEISCFNKTEVPLFQTALQYFVLGRSFISYSLLEYNVTTAYNLDFAPDACQAISFDAKGEESKLLVYFSPNIFLSFQSRWI